MTSLTEEVVSKTTRRASFTYLDRSVAVAWNKERKFGEPVVFCGWYWRHGTTEAGPFNTKSAAIRDAWYHLVQDVAPPRVLGPRLRRVA